jgi:hypothetical protein
MFAALSGLVVCVPPLICLFIQALGPGCDQDRHFIVRSPVECNDPDVCSPISTGYAFHLSRLLIQALGPGCNQDRDVAARSPAPNGCNDPDVSIPQVVFHTLTHISIHPGTQTRLQPRS